MAGFVNGFTGFGTALIASGVWFLILPPEIVPPLIIVCAMAGQVVGLVGLSSRLEFSKAGYLVSGGILGVPVGAALLLMMDPGAVKFVIGVFLVVYSAVQLRGLPKLFTKPHRDGLSDRIVGFIGGILGGFAGMAGPAPLIWLQLHQVPVGEQRARYQPFNFLIIGLATLTMLVIGKLNAEVLQLAIIAVPFAVAGAIIGVKAYVGVSEQTFKRVVLILLFASGCAIIAQ